MPATLVRGRLGVRLCACGVELLRRRGLGGVLVAGEGQDAGGDQPGCGQAAVGDAAHGLPPRGVAGQHGHEADEDRDRAELSDLEADVEHDDPAELAVLGEPEVLQARGQTEAMDQAEAQHGRVDRPKVLGPAAQAKDADEQHAERDHDVDRGRADLPAGEGRDDQRGAVAGDEQRDQLGGAAEVAGQQTSRSKYANAKLTSSLRYSRLVFSRTLSCPDPA